jgi:hypothetical protein
MKLLIKLVDETKHMKIIITDVLIWGKEQNETEGKLNHWNLIIKEFGLKINMDKMVTGFQGTCTQTSE